MKDREKVLTALAICVPETEADEARTCDECPYDEQCWIGSVTLPVALVEDIREVMKEQGAG